MNNYLHLAILTLLVISLDIFSGVAKAIMTDGLSSGALRKGLWHKTGFIVIFMLSCVIAHEGVYAGINVSLPLPQFATMYIVTTEVVSIIENVCALSPELSKTRLASIFDIKDDTVYNHKGDHEDS